MNDLVLKPACGMKRVRAPLKFWAVKPASKFIAA